MATATGKTQWHASYWDENKHGSAWNQIRESFKRDWVHAPAVQNPDFSTRETDDRPTEPGPDVIRPAGVIDPKGFTKAKDVRDGERLEREFEENATAFEYGFVAHEYYRPRYDDWNEEVERKLESEWNPEATGMKFQQAREYVRRGWQYKK